MVRMPLHGEGRVARSRVRSKDTHGNQGHSFTVVKDTQGHSLGRP